MLTAPLAKDGKLRLLYDDGYLPTKEEEVDVRIEQVQLEQVSRELTVPCFSIGASD